MVATFFTLDHWQNGLGGLAAGLIAAFGIMFIRRVIVEWVLNRIKSWAEHTSSKWDDIVIEAVRRPLTLVILICGLWLGANLFIENGLARFVVDPTLLKLLAMMVAAVKTVSTLALAVCALWFLLRLTDGASEYISSGQSAASAVHSERFGPLVRNTIKTLLAGIGVVYGLKVIGIDVQPILATAGVMGIVIGFAVRDVIADMFGALCLVLDRPFVLGDEIKVDALTGLVEEMGLRSTRIRSADKTVVAIPNRILAGTSLENLTRRPAKRKSEQVLVLSHKTRSNQLEAWLAAVRATLEGMDKIEKGSVSLYTTSLAAQGIQVHVLFWVEVPTVEEFRIVQEKANLAILRQLEQGGIEFAAPVKA